MHLLLITCVNKIQFLKDWTVEIESTEIGRREEVCATIGARCATIGVFAVIGTLTIYLCGWDNVV